MESLKMIEKKFKRIRNYKVKCLKCGCKNIGREEDVKEIPYWIINNKEFNNEEEAKKYHELYIKYKSLEKIEIDDDEFYVINNVDDYELFLLINEYDMNVEFISSIPFLLRLEWNYDEERELRIITKAQLENWLKKLK